MTLHQIKNQWNKAAYRWAPNPGGQYWFMRCPYWEILLEGDRGSGKTEAILMKFSKYVNQGFGHNWTGIIFRQSYPELDSLIQKADRYFSMYFPEPAARYNRTEHTWHFADGERLMFRYGRRPEDYWEYHGGEFPFIGFDEASQWRNDRFYKDMKSCSRSVRSDMPKFIVSGTNPWGPGRPWLKKRFIDPAPRMHPITERYVFDDGHSEELKRCAITIRLYENTKLLEKDPLYPVKIKDATKGDKEKEKAWLYNRWDVTIGAFFMDIWDDDIHIIKKSDSFWPPKHWRCYRAFDWGSAAPFDLQWWTESDGTEAPNGKYYPRGSLILFNQWYGNNKNVDDPNTGLKMPSPKIREGIDECESIMEKEHGIKISKGPADPSIWAKDGTHSIADDMKADEIFFPGDNKRIPGWQKCREMIIGGDGGPKVYAMDRCRDFIRQIGEILRDERNPDDIDTDQEDHSMDTFRMMVLYDPHKYGMSTFCQSDLFGF